ncbi:phage portal protein [Treponema zuelzerae]|uniref:Phage portal protein n=2 Tax=Teretinema zuelzerae TaxID=156 RepID=A0AAE3EHI2_9SPIR|nr:phage portal protein [Teretinema zuelzerae]
MRLSSLVSGIRKSIESFSFTAQMAKEDPFGEFASRGANQDYYLSHAWVNIAIGILMRNIGRTEYVIKKNGQAATGGKVFDLFNEPNPFLNRFDLWKETAAWWFLEGEAFWYFGNDYSGGLPDSIFVLNPRRMTMQVANGSVVRWFYGSDGDVVPLLPDEIIHFRDWNPWNPWRGVTPLVSLRYELDQDTWANKSNTDLLKHNAIPQGILKTDQLIREEEADLIEARWERKYGASSKNRKIAVIGKGTEFKPLTFSPDVLKLFDLKRWNLYTILAKYGIPPRVANIQDVKSSLSGSDTESQHAAFWKYTLIPVLKNFEQIVESQFFRRFALAERGTFDFSAIPELQQSEDAQSQRDIEEITAGLKTVNDVLLERGKEPKVWGDTWYRPANVIPVNTKEL